MYEQNLMSLSLSPKIKHFVDSVVCVCACAEIKAMPDLNLESDMKLDKLESFLGKLNNKSESFTDMSINGACLHVGMEADSYKWYQTIFYKSNIWHGAVGFPFRSCCKTVLFKYWEPGKRWSFHSDVSENVSDNLIHIHPVQVSVQPVIEDSRPQLNHVLQTVSIASC